MRLPSPIHLPPMRRSARLAGHPVVLDGEDAPTVTGHAVPLPEVADEAGEAAAVTPDAAPLLPLPRDEPALSLPSAREVAAAEAARARLYGGVAGPSAGGGEVSSCGCVGGVRAGFPFPPPPPPPSLKTHLSTLSPLAHKPPRLPPGPPPGAVEVPLLATADLPSLGSAADAAAALAAAVAALASPPPATDWATTALALEALRRGVAHHRAAVGAAALEAALPGIVAAIQSLRSALCRVRIHE